MILMKILLILKMQKAKMILKDNEFASHWLANLVLKDELISRD